ncbi:MAG: hypothetical protein K5765_00520 [Clostridia bacterium]|nr:hypothetical protein [Clostridia bacterium]
MKIIVVRVASILSYPPTISLINALKDLGNEVIVCTTLDSKGCENSIDTAVKIEYIPILYSKNNNLINRIFLLNRLKRKLWQCLNNYYDDNTIIWIEDDISIKHLGYKILRYKYILRFDELNERIYYSAKIKLFHMNEKKLCDSAINVVCPEYNRAHIMKAWWNLKKIPIVLPNKPYSSSDLILKYEFDDETKKILEMIGKRKIVLYQGMVSDERPIEPFIRAISKMNDYVFLVMGWNYDDLRKKNYNNCYFLNRIAPPYHLNITSKAYIGVISYRPVRGSNSVLNTIYCAPNKVFEYGAFGVPMLSNDLPGLRVLFDKYNSGIATELEEDLIISSIKKIEENYDSFSDGALNLYKNVDIKEIIKRIIS